MGVQGLLLLGIVLLYTCIPSVLSFHYYDGGDDSSGYGYADYGYGRWWCTCRWRCLRGERTVRYRCLIPFFKYYMRTCCKRLSRYQTDGHGGLGGYSRSDYGTGYGDFGGYKDPGY